MHIGFLLLRQRVKYQHRFMYYNVIRGCLKTPTDNEIFCWNWLNFSMATNYHSVYLKYWKVVPNTDQIVKKTAKDNKHYKKKLQNTIPRWRKIDAEMSKIGRSEYITIISTIVQFLLTEIVKFMTKWQPPPQGPVNISSVNREKLFLRTSRIWYFPSFHKSNGCMLLAVRRSNFSNNKTGLKILREE